MANGRGAWTSVGMPKGATTGYYELLQPNVGAQPALGQAYLAVHYGVKAIQERINELGRSPALEVDGDFGPLTTLALRWAQQKVGVAVDGQFGPATSLAFFWPVIESYAGANADIVGAITHLESGFDPGAVGFVVANDLGLVQINQEANPSVTVDEMFDYHFALKYLSDRIGQAIRTYSIRDAAICSYNDPEFADEWEKIGKAPNAIAQQYVDLVLAWHAP